ncbi:hypothetical protein BDW22DRAFT_1362736 [Trametopsis cervina]|nr:hypothetical protein BDW22DRAFT_1362736 [Trametopsis cervina]
MGAPFWIVNFDKKCYGGGGAKLGELFLDGLPIDLLHWVIPVWDTKTLIAIRRDCPHLAHHSASPDSKLLRLPDELLRMVFLMIEAEDFFDAASLCLADGRLLDIGYNELQRLKISVYADCAGDRIAGIAGWPWIMHLPESLTALAKEHAAEVPPQARNSWLKDNDLRLDVDVTYKKIVPIQYMKDQPFLSKLSRAESYAFSRLKCVTYTSSQPWVLCNISKGVYVRADAVAKLAGKECDGSPLVDGRLGLDQAFLSQICWATESSLAMVYQGGDEDAHGNIYQFNQGPWAGDRFEVTTIDCMKKNIEWRDVSAKIVNILEKICLGDFRNNWRKALEYGRRRY